MLARITGTLESLNGNAALVDLADWGGGGAYLVLVPMYLADRLSGKWAGGAGVVGQAVTFHTLQYLESLNQGASFIPRLIGFASAGEREFFELLTSVKGLGNKRALRAMTVEPGTIARSIHDRDTRALQRLPEIGPKLAELIVHELKSKVEPYIGGAAQPAAAAPTVEPKMKKPRVRLSDAAAGAVDSPGSSVATASSPPTPPAPPPPVRQTVETLIALGESPLDAERMVARAIDRARAAEQPPPRTPQELLAAAYLAR
jgi:Holliday junction DNA helicase RuvA